MNRSREKGFSREREKEREGFDRLMDREREKGFFFLISFLKYFLLEEKEIGSGLQVIWGEGFMMMMFVPGICFV